MSNKKCSFYNLGCKVNSYELEAVTNILSNNGFDIVDFNSNSDVVIINTCTVTNAADHKSRQMIHKARKLNPSAVIVAMGCFVQLMNQNDPLNENLADIYIGNNDKDKIVEILTNYFNHTENNNSYITSLDKASYDSLEIASNIHKSRAYVKIEDGCNKFCSYCAIPLARGRVRSRGKQSIVDEINRLISNNYKEIILTGINLSSYGVDIDSSLGELMSYIKDNISDKIRIRLSSLEPGIITEDFLKILSSYEGFCPHFHLALQSGCDKTLNSMNRKYTTSEYKTKVEMIRKVFKSASLTTDVIVGFPGESEDDFNNTYNFIDSLDFFMTHIFKFSARANTKAFNMKGQIIPGIKNTRSKRLLELNSKKIVKFMDGFINKEVEVLTESTKEINNKKYLFGHTKEYIPVYINSNLAKINEVIKVKPSGYCVDKTKGLLA